MASPDKVIKDDKTIKDLFDEGIIVPVRAIYEVKFKPIFKLKDKLGYIADKLKVHYTETSIINEESKKEEVINFIKSNIVTYFSFSTFKVVNISLRSEFNIEDIVMEINNAPRKITGLNIFGQKDEDKIKFDIERIGVRLEYIGNINKNIRLEDFDKRKIFNQDFLNSLGCGAKKDKLWQVRFKIGEENCQKGDTETILTIQSKTDGMSLDSAWRIISERTINKLKGSIDSEKLDILKNLQNYKLFQEELCEVLKNSFDDEEINIIMSYTEIELINYNFQHVAHIDLIRGYFKPENIETNYLYETLNIMKDKILPLF